MPPLQSFGYQIILTALVHAVSQTALLHFGSLHLCFQDFLSKRTQVNADGTQRNFNRTHETTGRSRYLFFI